MHCKGQQVSLEEIAETLNVDYVVEGSVLRARDRVRINVQLIDARRDRNVWAENYDHDVRDVLAVQSEAAMKIADEIKVTLSPREEVRLAARTNISPASYEAYLRGRFFSNRRTKQDLEQALEQFHSVVESDPESGLGYAGVADANILMALHGFVPPREAWPKAKAAAERAVALDQFLSEAHASLGLIRSYYEWNWSEAERAYRTAIDVNPNDATARHRYAIHLSRLGRHAEAIEEVQRARELDPLSLAINNAVGIVYLMARRYDDAVKQLIANRELSEDYYRTYMNLGRCYVEQDKCQQALEALARASELSGENPFVVATLAHGYGRAGDKAKARELLSSLKEISTSKYVSPVSIALVQVGLEDHDAAFESLRAAVREHAGYLVWLKVEPVFDALRSDPRFNTLLAEVGFTE
jgi:tetratricopeptide (TPR) repeat protein